MSRKIVLLYLCMIVMIVVGCGKKESNSNIQTVNYWAWLDNPNDTTLQDLVKQFNEENKTIHVNLEVIPWNDYRNKLLTSTIGGEAPDAAAFKLTWMPEFLGNKSLESLDKYLENWDKRGDISKNLWEIIRNKENGEIYAMPWELQVLYMYYRPSLFSEAGINEVPETWEEFLEVSKRLTKDTNGDGRVDQYAFGMRGARYGHEPWGSFIFSNVPNNEIMENNSVKFDTEAAREANSFFIDLYTKYSVVPETAPTDGFSQIISNFKSGRTAMVVHHIKSSNGMIEQFGEDVGAFPVPAGSEGRWTSMGDTENVMFSSSKNKEATFKFISWLAEADQVDKWCKATGNVPIVESIRGDEYYKNNRFMQASFDSIDFAGVYPVNSKMGEWIELVWPGEIQKALLKEITPDEAFDNLVKGMKE